MINISIKGIAIVFLLHEIYYVGDFLQFQWVTPFLIEIKSNIDYLFSGNWVGLTHLFRSLLFFILLAFMVYLLQYWLIQRKKIFPFFLLTTVYITILDTFTAYDASWAIVRTVLSGFLMMGILTLQRLRKNGKIDFQTKTTRKWLLSLLIMIVLSVSIGYVLPKADPIWPDPVSFIKNDLKVGSSSKTIGYGVDDSSLGGSLSEDRTIVFQTKVESDHYWKVENKDVYTGKGWVQSNQEAEPIPFSSENNVPIISFIENGAVEKNVQTSTVKQMKEYPHVVYPFGVTKIGSGDHYSFELDPSIEKVNSFIGTEPASITEYYVTYEKPNYSMIALQATKSLKETNLSEEFIAQYTQLPDELPERVRDLAAEITAEEETWYDKAKAIERYLKGPTFSYSLQDVAIPGADEDYVDQFLFETMVGYCNNFSTSMIVLLRSLDIPARWVKGYTEGEYISYNDGMYEYEVTNNNAHAWVEAYFPLVGWVTFDPTPGFSNPIQYYLNEEESVEEMTANIESTEPEEPEKQEQDTQTTTAGENQTVSLKEIGENIMEFFSRNIVWFYAFILVMILTGFYLYRIRAKWLPKYYIRKFKHLEGNESFIDAYLVLLKQLNRAGYKRKSGQTLREYADEIDRHFSTNEMKLLTRQYEKYLYGNGLETDIWSTMKQLWENLIKRSVS